MNATPEELLQAAVRIAKAAGELTMRHFRAGVAVETKADRSPVTIADREAERLCRRMIAETYPDDGVLGEEFGHERPRAARQWIIDPIDGTISFVRGVPLFGVLVAVEVEAEAIVGVAHFPAIGETVAAASGCGCFFNGHTSRVSDVDDLAAALVLTTDASAAAGRELRDGWARLSDRAGLARTWGDCYGHALVATGRAEAMVDPILCLWDSAALLPIVREAGGVYTDARGRADHRGSEGISTNAALAGQVRELLGVSSPDGGS